MHRSQSRMLPAGFAACVVAVALLAATPIALAQLAFVERPIDGIISTVRATVDLDGDGDEDLLCTHVEVFGPTRSIVWYENSGATPPVFIPHSITPAPQPYQVPIDLIVADMDGDGDPDILAGGGVTSPTIAWYENDGAASPTFTYRAIRTATSSAWTLRAADIDGDGDVDIISDTENYQVFSWYENDGHVPPAFIFRPLLLTNNVYLSSFHIADLDGDSHLDIFGHSYHGFSETAAFRWYKNDGGSPPQFTEFTIDPNKTSGGLIAADIDSDFDLDLVAGDGYFENSGDAPPVFTKQSFGFELLGAQTKAITDMDADGDLDLLFVTRSSTALEWLENDGRFTPAFVRHTIQVGFYYISNLLIADLDGDSDLDIITALGAPVSSVVWYENVEVLNEDQGRVFPLLRHAIEEAASGDHLLSHPQHFASEVEPVLDLLGKALDVRSRGALVRPGATETILAEGSALRAADGEDVLVEGALIVPEDAVAELRGQNVTIAGELFMGGDAGLIVGTNTLLQSKGFEDRAIAAGDTPYLGATRAGDMDGDGDMDVVAAASSRILLYENDGAVPPRFVLRILGTIALEPDYSQPNPYKDYGQGAQTLRIADFDGDSDLDVMTNVGFNYQAILWINDGKVPAGFSPTPLSIAFGEAVSDALPVDLDGDSDVDLVWRTSGGIGWSESDGGAPPAFAGRGFPPGGVPGYRDVAAADLDGDGDIDVFAGALRTRSITWFENDGASPPAFTRHEVSISQYATRLVAADLDGDGDVDVLNADINNGTFGWYENEGAKPPTFLERNFVTQGPAGREARVADIDGDGDLDIVTSLTTTAPNYSLVKGPVVWYENDGASSPTFAQRIVSSDVDDAVAFELVDFDGDGVLDVLSSSTESDSITWHRNSLFDTLVLAQGAAIACKADVAVINRAIEVHSLSVLSADGTMTLDRTSSLRGSGVVSAAAVASAGLIEPMPAASLAIVGDYIQSFDDGVVGLRAGVLAIDLGEGSQPSRLDITGAATLAGALRATGALGFAPTIGATFDILSAAALTPGSRFSTALLPSIGSDRFLAVVYRERPPLTPQSRPHEFEVVDETPPESADAGLIAAASVALVVNALTGDIELDPQAGADSGAAGVPKGATLADIDGDGDPDLLIALPDATNPATANGSVVILYNADDGNPGNGWEGFGDTLQISTGVGVNPSSVAVGRIDADAQPDIVVANRGTPGNTANDTVSVLLVSNPSAVTFATSATFSVVVGDEPADVIIADLDGDGFLDIATANAGSDSISVGWNAGAGTGPTWPPFTTAPMDLPDDEETPVSIRPGDTNAGTFTFLATANSGTNTIGVFQVNPNRSIAALPSLPAGNAPVEVVVADFDLDGEADIASINRNGSSVTMVLGATGASPTLAMGLPTTLPIPTSTTKPRSIAAGDFDADASGDIDIAVLADGVVKILRNDLFNGQLAFTPIPDQAAGATPLLVRSADLNGDGRDDVVTIAQSTGALALAAADGGRARTGSAPVQTLLAVAAPTPCAGDVNGDDVTNAADFVVLAGNFGSSVTPNTNGDLNGDGLVNAADFVILAGDFGCGN